jgi:endoglycosylceramidase
MTISVLVRFLLITVGSLLALLHPVSAWKVAGNQILDSQGRSRIFHGMDITYKSAPYVPRISSGPANLSFNSDDAKLLSSLGVNLVRLNVQWSGVEPIRGQYDMDYISQMKAIVTILDQYNIYVIIEQHQDKYSEMFCGEGFPMWASKNIGFLGLDRFKFPWPAQGVMKPAFEMKPQPELHKGIYEDYLIPGPGQCGGFQSLVAWATAKNYERLYKNEDGLLDKFTDYWAL